MRIRRTFLLPLPAATAADLPAEPSAERRKDRDGDQERREDPGDFVMRSGKGAHHARQCDSGDECIHRLHAGGKADRNRRQGQRPGGRRLIGKRGRHRIWVCL